MLIPFYFNFYIKNLYENKLTNLLNLIIIYVNKNNSLSRYDNIIPKVTTTDILTSDYIEKFIWYKDIIIWYIYGDEFKYKSWGSLILKNILIT